MTLTLSTVTLHNPKFEEESSSEISSDEFVNANAPTVDTTIWNKSPRILIVTCRQTDYEKDQIETLAEAHTITTLENGETWTVWIRRIKSKLAKNEDEDYPWKMELELVVT